MPPLLEPPLLELLLPELLLLELLLELDEPELLLELDELELDTPELPPDDNEDDDAGDGDEVPPQATSAAAQISSGSSKTLAATTVARGAALDAGGRMAMFSIAPPRAFCVICIGHMLEPYGGHRTVCRQRGMMLPAFTIPQPTRLK